MPSDSAKEFHGLEFHFVAGFIIGGVGGTFRDHDAVARVDVNELAINANG